DFGLARIEASSGSEDMSSAYMSPEQARGAEVDARSDIFSAGAVLYELMTGKNAFARDTHADTVAAILKEDPSELNENPPGWPQELVSILKQCLAKDPQNRFASARDAALALRAVQTTMSAPRPELQVSSFTRLRNQVLLAFLVILIVLIYIGYYSLPPKEAEQKLPIAVTDFV